MAAGKDLTQGNVFKQLIEFSVPFFLAQILQALYSMADMLIAGKFMGDCGISAINGSSSIIMFITMLLSGFSIGGTVLVAQYTGAGQRDEAKKSANTLFAMFFYFAVVFSVLGLLLRQFLLEAVNIPQEAFAEAKNYITICFAGTVFICGYNAVSAVLRGLGDSKRPLYFVAVSSAINILLDFIFVGALKWGAGGAALATVMAQAFSFALAVKTLYREKEVFNFGLGILRLDTEKLKMILKIGIPSALQSGIVNISMLFVISNINSYGLAASTAAGIGSKIDSFAILPTIAIGQSVSSMVGQNLGAERIDRAKDTFWAGLLISFVFGLIIFSFVNLRTKAIYSLFGCSAQTMEIGRMYIKLSSIAYIANSITFIINNLAAGSGNAIFAMLSAITSVVLARIPLIYLFETVCGMGLNGIFLAIGVGQFAGMIFGIGFYLSGKWKKILIKEV